ncbi:MAG: site-specific DNA-methyltransferase [Chloroflexota bacterium]|nr:site-specific DNA-methyltransferase [Chloroflexota bacterium]
MPTLEFKGKNHIYAHHLTVPYRPLELDESRSILPKAQESDALSIDQNLIIHGDNLEALKALLPHYAGRVKCIYIDPPYNTGNEGWIYNDKVNSPLMREWFEKNSPVDGEDLERYDKWLCMMWPRLHLLRSYLRDDGVIFVSIDDNEHHHLKMLMDEIFGEENYCGTFVWERKKKPSFLDRNMGTVTEYVVAYAQYRQHSPAFVAGNVELGKRYPFNNASNPVGILQFPAGSVRFSISDQVVKSQNMSTPNIVTELLDDVEILDGTNANRFRLKGAWRYSQSKLNEFVTNRDEITISRIPFRPNYINRAGKVKKTINLLSHRINDVPTNEDATEELRAIFDDIEGDVFDYPKPTGLLSHLIRAVSSGNDIVLDSFAGSGTAAHAVLSSNREDGSNRRFIMIECEDKYADSVTAERVRRVIRGVPNAKDKQLKEGLGGSFAYCTLGEPIDIDSLLKGDDLPSYSDLASYLLHTATGISTSPHDLNVTQADGHFYSDGERDYYLIYQPSLEFLRDGDAALNLERAERICDKGQKAIVFAATKYISQSVLSKWNITFCQLPYELGLGG